MRNYSPPRITCFALGLCGFLALPYLSLYYDINTPVSDFTGLPVYTIHLLGAIAHELGHTAARWFLGYPAFPSLDMEYGGGVTYAASRLMALQAGVYFILAGLLVRAWRLKKRVTFAALCALVLLHIPLSLTRGHEVVILYAGHATEVALGASGAWWCLFMGERPRTPYLACGDFTLRIMGAAAGFYLVLKNLLLCLELMASAPLRFSYELQKGLKAQGDFSWIGDITGLDVPDAAGLLFFTALPLILFVIYAGMKDRKDMMPSRLALCLLTVVTSLLAYGFDQFNLYFPFSLRLLLLPVAEAGHYMAVIFHEPGHAVSHWLFGIPALPLVDAVSGGGMTYSLGRSYAVLTGVYVLFAGAALLALYMKRKDYALLAVAAAFLHGALVYTEWEPAVTLFMGHGLEAIVAGILLRRAIAGWNLQGRAADSFVSLAVSLHLSARVLMLGLGLSFSEARRLSYYVQKGMRGEADLDRLSSYLGVSTQSVALFLCCFVAACLSAGVYAARRDLALKVS